ncbi:hypothetical protein ACFWBB_26590 [Streptomyces sp. NPDC060000]|uniref:hypothetical protein n=1 Tax=Streptomyces sp. NPDC060000 TaxID=3347031 RepID=UPI00368839D7
MIYDDDVEDRMAAEYQERQRQVADLGYIRRYYALEQRHGIRVAIGGRVRSHGREGAIGGRVRSHGREGAIVDTSGHYLIVQFDGEELPARRHVTSNMEYATTAGWVAARAVADPCATARQGA